MTPRFHDWEAKLIGAVEAAKGIPFQWGVHDCCHFSATCVEAMTGTNPLTPFLGKYNDKKSSLQALKLIGNGSLSKTLEDIFGPAVSPAAARRGDLSFAVFDDGPTVGVCLGQYSVFTGEIEGQPGLVTIPTREVSKIFRV